MFVANIGVSADKFESNRFMQSETGWIGQSDAREGHYIALLDQDIAKRSIWLLTDAFPSRIGSTIDCRID